MPRKKINTRSQLIVCYDIENSVLYEVYYYYQYRDTYIKCKNFQSMLYDYMGCKYIDIHNKDIAEKCIRWANNKHGMHYVLIPVTHKYIANLYIYDCTTKQIDSKFSYKPITDNMQFFYLINEWSNNDKDILFTAHNLDYEYSYIRFNTNLLENLKAKCTSYKIIAENTTNIKSLEFVSETGSKFIIRDTYLMSNKSIKNLGNEYSIPKLDYDYQQTRLNPEDINDLDKRYNQRDNEIAMQYILHTKDTLSMYKDITKLPLSATQHAKNVCKNNPNVNYKPKNCKCDLFTLHKLQSKKYNMPNFDLYRNFFNASGGGVIGVNPKFTRMWIENVHSFDIKSAHPSQFYNKPFPLGNSIKEVNNYEWIIKHYEGLAEKMSKSPQDFYNIYYPTHDHLLLVEFTELEAKKLPHDNIILSMPCGKDTQIYSENGVTNRQAYNYKGYVVNGKTQYSKVYRKWVYGIDLIYHLSFYDYDNIKILKAYKYKLERCDSYIISKANYYGTAKETYKKCANFAKQNSYEDTIQKAVDLNLEQYTIDNIRPEDYKPFLAKELLRIKGIFNGLFGQEYTNIYHQELDFTDNFEITNKEYDLKFSTLEEGYQDALKNTSVHYCVGAYTAAWSRFELACMIHHCINNGGTVVYFHTDSIKCYGCSSHIFDNWYQKEQIQNPYKKNNKYDFGSVAYEETYTYFYVPETLKNIGIMESKDHKIIIDITLSGIKADIYFKDILSYNGKEWNNTNLKQIFRKFRKKLKPQIISGELTGKLARDRKFQGIKTDQGQYNFGALVPVEYSFLMK